MEKEQIIKKFSLSDDQIKMFEQYIDILSKYNEHTNLVGKSTLLDPWNSHILDSLQVVNMIQNKDFSILDMGTGAGLPGVILNICGYKNVTLIDSNGKKIKFLKFIKNKMNLNFNIILGRIELLDSLGYDVITSRALANLDKLFSYSQKFIKNNTLLIFLKGKTVNEELNLARKNWLFDLKQKKSLSDERGNLLIIKNLKKMSKIISIANQKGGVGKTTTAINLSTAMAAINKKILLIDADPQGNASTGLGISKEERAPSLYDLITNKKFDIEAIKKTIIPNLDIITSSHDLAASEIELAEQDDRENILKKILMDIEGYDFIFIDCPPALGLLTINSLVASNSVIVPLQCEFFALEGLSALTNTIEVIKSGLNSQINLEGIVLTMHDKRNSLSSLVEEDVRSHFKDKVYNTVIPRNVRISEAPSHGKPVLIYDTLCIGSKAYIGLAKEVILNQ